MLERIKSIAQKKYFHICATIVIVVAILFTLGIIILKYNVEGEKNMPFELSKIIVISSAEGIDKDIEGKKWSFDINQNNDIYLYITKNSNYLDQSIIKSIKIDNIKVERSNEVGSIKFYRPNTLETGGNFSNKEENLVETLEYKGAMESDLKKLEISNQGGLIVFRYALDKVAEYSSNDEEIKHNELLKKSGIKEEDLKSKLIFDLSLETETNKEYKANLILELPIEGIVEKGIQQKEITDFKDTIFKRTKN